MSSGRRSVDGSGRWQVSDAGGFSARWGPDGKTIFYGEGWNTDGAIKQVAVAFDAGVPRLGRPQVVVAYPISKVQTLSGSFDVHPIDGRFVVAAAMWDALESSDPVMIQGWFEAD